MSTHINDLASQVLFANASGSPADNTTTLTGSGVDMETQDGNCFAVQDVGTVSGTNPTLNGKIQESADNSTGWTDVTGGGFAQVTASTSTKVITFQRTKRYLRYVGTIAGTTPHFVIAAYVGGPLKQT